MKFKEGDRVRKYNMNGYSDFTIREIDHSGLLILEDSSDHSGTQAHPKQCRRLIKKGRRRVYLAGQAYQRIMLQDGIDSSGVLVAVSAQKLLNDDIEFIEVRKNKK